MLTGVAEVSAPATPIVPLEDPVVSDERTRIEDLRTVAKWQLAALGAVATLAFTGVALNKLPNAGMATEGGFWMLVIAAVGALVTLISITSMITYVGWVLAPQYQSLDDQLRLDELSKKTRPSIAEQWELKERLREANNRQSKLKISSRWYNQAVWYLPDVSIRDLSDFEESKNKLYDEYARLKKSQESPENSKKIEAIEDRFAAYYEPVSLRLHWRNKRENVATRARRALSMLGKLSGGTAAGVVLYLGATAYHLPDLPSALRTFNLPAYGVWRPLSMVKPEVTLATLKADLGDSCPGTMDTTKDKGMQVMVLEEIPAEQTYQVLVTNLGCRPFRYTVAKDSVAARDEFALLPHQSPRP
ncbi:hypothetical protein EHF33_20480 (plasmid) [Deinococcus psychrotolerans]|uniref:Uncharacterized protein n=1 Tax=Deinococcus psychrotolerans TaxID=2489213 RepID=A0A3G8YJ44_9DEIO|nr:hypothetical protein [Deinococcus psychrotolerans]AZI45288.1 hypothetical protein EHF33_20480 [Deinococcus psychrotolerans]